MNVIGIGNYGLINSNYAKKTSTDEVQVSTSFADIVQNKLSHMYPGWVTIKSLHPRAFNL